MTIFDTDNVEARADAMKLTRTQREVLMDHIDGTRRINVHTDRHRAVLVLVKRGIVGITQDGKHSRINKFGRSVLAALLAHYVEALTRAAEARDERMSQDFCEDRHVRKLIDAITRRTNADAENSEARGELCNL
jgi:hypothetical protein